jgi:hypothetical protein
MYLSAQGRITQQGRAIVQYDSPQVKAVAAYEYSRRNHSGAWLLIQFAVLSKARIAVHRDQFSILTPGADERRIPLATQEQFLDDQDAITQLLQNATVSRRPLDPYFTVRPVPTLRFFARPGSLVHDSAVTNLDEAAAGDLFFKSPTGRWAPGTHRLVLNHPEAQAQLPIELE